MKLNKLPKSIFIIVLLFVLIIPSVIASYPIKALDVVNLGLDKENNSYGELSVNINFPDTDKSPLYTISFTPTLERFMFSLVDEYRYGSDKLSYMVNDNGSVNNSANLSFSFEEKEPDVTAPIIYTDYDEVNGGQGGILGWHYLLSSSAKTKEEFNDNIKVNGNPYILFYGYLLPMDVAKNEKTSISFKRLSDFKGFNNFWFPFTKGEIKLNLLLSEKTIFSNIQITKNSYPDWLVDYQSKASKFYINNEASLPLKEDSEFIRYSSDIFMKKEFERGSILSINIQYKLRLIITIGIFLFYFVSSFILFIILKRFKKSMWFFFTYQGLLFVALHTTIYSALGINVIFLTILDIILLILNVIFFFIFKKYNLLR